MKQKGQRRQERKTQAEGSNPLRAPDPLQVEKGVFPVVGIGASAGGLKPLQRFFEGVPVESGMAFVVIMHLSPTHESHVAEILQASTSLPVKQVNERIAIEPNKVYVIPPSKDLSMQDGYINLSEPDRRIGRHTSIDLFFRTLADTHNVHAACVVLSGSGSDGSIGLKRVKEQGGVCLAQDPSEAEYDSMPRNAILTGMVDFVLPVAEMPAKLIEVWRNSSQIKLPVEAVSPIVDESQEAETALCDVLNLLRSHTGHDFTHYKRATVLRRIERRMQVVTIRNLPAYHDYLHENPAEASLLLKDLLIGVTNFFRDREAFDALEREIIPLLFQDKLAGDHVRVWTAACATGEEAYSVAMLLLEHAARLSQPPHIQVFASDIDELAIAAAREGSYPAAIEADVSPARLRQFFTKEAGGYRINKEVRERILFATHNLLKDPPFSNLDLVTCRNLLIYLNRDVQEQVFELFHFSLRPGGFLFLGSSESTDGRSDLFTQANAKHHIFRANTVTRVARAVPSMPLEPSSGRQPHVRSEGASERKRIAFGDLHEKVLEQYAPPSLIVNADHEIVHLSEHAGRYLLHAGGEPSLDLLKVILPELRLELRTALYQAAQTGKSTEARRVYLTRGGHASYVNMVVRPIHDVESEGVFHLIIFDEVEESLGTDSKERPGGKPEPVVRSLEQENQNLKERLQRTVEQYETTVEELKASNEEHRVTNEELRSTTEELETSKEELQSVNEELRTVNDELQRRVEEVGTTNNNLQNLISSTDIATIFLDRSLRIRLFTPAAVDLFNLIPVDEGRELTDITHRLDYPDFLADANEVLKRLHKVEREVTSQGGQTYLARITPYRTSQDYIEGVVVTFVDITERKRAEGQLAAELKKMRDLYDSSTRLLITRDLRAALDEILDAAIRLLQADFGNVQLYDPANGALEIFVQRGFQDEFLEAFRVVTADSDSACGLAIRGGERCIIEDVEQDVTHKPYRQIAAAAGYRAVQSTPLLDRRGRPLGVLSTHFREPHRPTESELQTLDLYARLAVEFIVRTRDEAALRESEARLRRAVEIESVGVIFFNTDGRVHDANAAFLQMSGYDREDLQNGLVRWDVMTPPEWMEASLRAVAEFQETGRTSPYEKECVRKDGSRWWALFAATRLAQDEGVEFIVDITDRKRADEALKKSYGELEQKVEARTRELLEAYETLRREAEVRQASETARALLLRHFVEAQEEERRHHSRELHDQFGQQIAALKLNLDLLTRQIGEAEGMRERLDIINSIVRRLDEDVDFLAWELRPSSLDDLGLPVALNTYVQEWAAHTGVAAQFHYDGNEERLAPEIEITLYRIAQEALNNIAKHAAAKTVSVILERRRDKLALIIEDDGLGFDTNQPGEPDPKKLGLVGMRERAAIIGGTVEIESGAGTGTSVFVRLPLTSKSGLGAAQHREHPSAPAGPGDTTACAK